MSRTIFAGAAVLFAFGAAAAGWSSPTRATFISSCVGGAAKNDVTEKSAKAYCVCVTDDLEKKYSEAELKAVNVAPSEKFKADMQAAAGACAKLLAFVSKPGQTGWAPTFRNSFVASCVGGAAGKGMDQGKVQKYCACMAGSLEKKYTDNEFAQASFKPTDKYNADIEKAAQGCVKGLK